MEYATQMDAARKGIYTKELLAVAEDEKIDKDELINELSELIAVAKSLVF